MKVAHVLGCPLNSGAGKAVLALHEQMLAMGVDSHVVGRIESGLPKHLNAHPATLLEKLRPGLANRFYLWRLRSRYKVDLHNFHPVSYGLPVFRSEPYLSADIIHIQFAAASTLGPDFWRALKYERRPVVWTLRDMWTFTGGCHFSGDCDRYTEGCGVCPQLGGASDEMVTARDLAFKATHIGATTTFVASSKSTADQARASRVLNGRDIRLLPNAVMLGQFDELSKTDARAALGLPADKMVVAAGSVNLADPRKGSATLKALLEKYREDDTVHWAIFGRGLDALIDKVPDNCTFFGLTSDPQKLNRIYAAADVFLMPSLQETFGKTTVESMASGTPVIGYRETPAEEIAVEGETGWLVPHGDIERFAATLAGAIAQGREALAAMGRRASQNVRARFDLQMVASAHLALYEDRLSALCHQGTG